MNPVDVVGFCFLGVIILMILWALYREYRPRRRVSGMTDHQRALYVIGKIEAEISAKPLPELIKDSYEEGERQWKLYLATQSWTPWFESDQFFKDLEQAEQDKIRAEEWKARQVANAKQARERAEKVERAEQEFAARIASGQLVIVEIDITAVNDPEPRTLAYLRTRVGVDGDGIYNDWPRSKIRKG